MKKRFMYWFYLAGVMMAKSIQSWQRYEFLLIRIVNIIEIASVPNPLKQINKIDSIVDYGSFKLMYSKYFVKTFVA